MKYDFCKIIVKSDTSSRFDMSRQRSVQKKRIVHL
jgi:hypothetical protein